MDEKETTCAVVMGDLVQSETSFAPDRLHDIFNKQVTDQNHIAANSLISPLTITLGDEFQGLVRNLTDALPIVQALRLGLLNQGIDCRFVIGLVTIRTPINRQRAWNMMGDGLSHARALLNEKDDSTFYRFSLPKMNALAAGLDGLGVGLTLIEKNWTPTQRQIVTAQVSDLSVLQIAKARGVSHHNIYKVRIAANYDAYRRQWLAAQIMLGQIDRETGLTP